MASTHRRLPSIDSSPQSPITCATYINWALSNIPPTPGQSTNSRVLATRSQHFYSTTLHQLLQPDHGRGYYPTNPLTNFPLFITHYFFLEERHYGYVVRSRPTCDTWDHQPCNGAENTVWILTILRNTYWDGCFAPALCGVFSLVENSHCFGPFFPFHELGDASATRRLLCAGSGE
jgi:hypothetical protein